jgi:hypothetical protein
MRTTSSILIRVIVLAALMALGLGCDSVLEKDPTPKQDGGTQADTSLDLARDTLPPPKHDLGPKTCPQSCPQVSGAGICVSGQVLLFPTLAAKWAGQATQATPLTTSDGAKLDILDPIAFVANPTTPKPLASAAIDANGCFVAKDVKIPFSGFFALGVDDDPATKNDRWVFTASVVMPVFGKNSQGLEVSAIAKQDVAAWATEVGVDPVKVGSMILVFVDKNGKAVEGVTPVLEGKDWPNWDDNPATGGPYALHFFDKDPLKPPFFSSVSATTTASGMALVIQAQVKTHSGTKSGLSVETGVGLSAPGTLSVRVMTVSSN